MTRKLILLFLLTATLLDQTRAALAPGEACTADSECEEFYICSGTCTHKSLFPDTSGQEMGGVIIALIANSLTNAGGVGAGGLLVPYLSLLNNFTPNTGIVVTYAMVFGGGVGTVVNVLFKRNPASGGPLISYNILMLCIPCLLAGVPIGVLLNKILAPVVINVLLFCLLAFNLYKIGQKFKENLKKERHDRQMEKEAKAQTKALETEAEARLQGETQRNNEQEKAIQLAEKKEEKSHVTPPSKGSQISQEAIAITVEENNKETEQKEEPSPTQQDTKLVYQASDKSKKNYLEAHGGDDHHHEEDELYDPNNVFGMVLMMSTDPKVIEEAREKERRETLERRKSIEHRRHTAELRRHTAEQRRNTGEHRRHTGEHRRHTAEHKNVESTPEELAAEDQQRRREAVQKREKWILPPHKLSIPCLSLIVVIIMNLLTGNAKFDSITGSIEYCSGGYWGLFALTIILQIVVFLLAIVLLFRWQKQKEELDIEFRPEEMYLTPKRTVIIFCVSFFAGVVGGVFAIGGALVIAPFLLGFGVPPTPLAATTAVFMIFTQLSTLIISILSSAYTGSELAFYLCVAGVLSFCVSKFVFWFVKKTKKQSVILGVLIAIVSISFIVNGVAMGVNLNNKKTFMTTFVSYC